MPTGAVFANEQLKLILNSVAISNIADNAASAPLTNLYISLHTADPSGGNQTTSEAAYTGYTRMSIDRTGPGWTVTGRVASPNSATAALTSFCHISTNGESYFVCCSCSPLSISCCKSLNEV